MKKYLKLGVGLITFGFAGLLFNCWYNPINSLIYHTYSTIPVLLGLCIVILCFIYSEIID